MKKFITSTALVLLAIFFLSACKKSNKQQTTLEKIQGVWQLETDIYNQHVSGQNNITTTTGAPGDNLDFRTDGLVDFNIAGSKKTYSYSISGDTEIAITYVFLPVTYDIIALTVNSLILHSKETTAGSSDFYEDTITLKK